MGEDHRRQILQRQPFRYRYCKLADHIRCPGAHHLGAQDAVALTVSYHLDKSSFLEGKDGFSVG